jgi:hypothetical protein
MIRYGLLWIAQYVAILPSPGFPRWENELGPYLKFKLVEGNETSHISEKDM